MSSRLNTKIIALALVVLLSFSSIAPFLNVKRAQAGLQTDIAVGILQCTGIIDDVVGDIVGKTRNRIGSLVSKVPIPGASIVGKFISGTTQTNDSKANSKLDALVKKEKCLDVIVSIGVNMALRSMMSSITEWANRGFEGKPAFKQNLKKHFKVVEAEATEQVLNQLNLGFLCSPFSSQIRDALQIQLAVQQSDSYFVTSSSCTINSILDEMGYTIDEFQNDFSKGGWAAFVELSQPQNNRYGIQLKIQEEIDRLKTEEQESRKLDVTIGKGFPSITKKGECIKWAKKMTSSSADGIDPEPETRTTPPGDLEVSDWSCVERDEDEIITPGSIVEAGLNKTIGLGADRLVLADEFNEMVSALLQAWLEKTLTSARGFAGLSDPDESGKSLTTQLANEIDDVLGVEIPGTRFWGEERNCDVLAENGTLEEVKSIFDDLPAGSVFWEAGNINASGAQMLLDGRALVIPGSADGVGPYSRIYLETDVTVPANVDAVPVLVVTGKVLGLTENIPLSMPGVPAIIPATSPTPGIDILAPLGIGGEDENLGKTRAIGFSIQKGSQPITIRDKKFEFINVVKFVDRNLQFFGPAEAQVADLSSDRTFHISMTYLAGSAGTIKIQIKDSRGKVVGEYNKAYLIPARKGPFLSIDMLLQNTGLGEYERLELENEARLLRSLRAGTFGTTTGPVGGVSGTPFEKIPALLFFQPQSSWSYNNMKLALIPLSAEDEMEERTYEEDSNTDCAGQTAIWEHSEPVEPTTEGGGWGNPGFGLKFKIDSMQPGVVYKNFKLEMDATTNLLEYSVPDDDGSPRWDLIFGISGRPIGLSKTFGLGVLAEASGKTSFDVHSYCADEACTGGETPSRFYEKRMTWKEHAKHHILFEFNGLTNTAHMKVTDEAGEILGETTIPDFHHTPYFVDNGGGVYLYLGEHVGWKYENIKIIFGFGTDEAEVVTTVSSAAGPGSAIPVAPGTTPGSGGKILGDVWSEWLFSPNALSEMRNIWNITEVMIETRHFREWDRGSLTMAQAMAYAPKTGVNFTGTAKQQLDKAKEVGINVQVNVDSSCNGTAYHRWGEGNCRDWEGSLAGPIEGAKIDKAKRLYRELVTYLKTNYPNVTHIQIENEPCYRTYSPEQYKNLVAAVVPEIKAANPNIKIIADADPHACGDAVPTAGIAVNILGFHSALPSGSTDSETAYIKNTATALKNKWGSRYEIWLDELGVGSDGFSTFTQAGANRLTGFTRAAFDGGATGVTIVYTGGTIPSWEEFDGHSLELGLFDPIKGKSQSATAIQALARELGIAR